MVEGNQRFDRHKAQRKSADGKLDDSWHRPGGTQTLTGPCEPSGNEAASSSGLDRRGAADAGKLDGSWHRPGGEQTLTGPCAPSGNEAAPSSGLKRSGKKRESLETNGNAEPGNSLENGHVRKYQRQ